MGSQLSTRSEIEAYIKAVTAPTTGEEWLIALRHPNSPVNKLINNIDFFEAVTVYELMEMVIIHNLETRREERLAQAEELRKEMIDARKELMNESVPGKEQPVATFTETPTELEKKIQSLQSEIKEQEKQIKVLDRQIAEKEETVSQYTKEWQVMHEERRDNFVDSLKEHYQNNIQVDKKGNPVLDENGQPKRAVILDADGKEITFDPEKDKERIDAVNNALDGKPTPKEMHQFTKGVITAEQCAKNGALNRCLKMVMAVHRLNPKDEDASSLKGDKEKSVDEVQAKIDAVREIQDRVDKRRELRNKIDKAETEEEKEELRQELDKLSEGSQFAAIKSNLVAAINRDKGITPDNPGIKCKAAPTYENFDGGKLGVKAKEDEPPTFYQKVEENIAATFEELDAKGVLEEKREAEAKKLEGMQADLKAAEEQKQAPAMGSKSGH